MKRPQLYVVFLLLVSWSDASKISEELAKLGFPDHYNGYMKDTDRDCLDPLDRPVGFCSDCFTQSICSTDPEITLPTDSACATGYVCFENDEFSACVLESDVPDCQCPVDETFVTIADPYDNEKFIVCVNGEGIPEECQDGEAYDPSVNDCVNLASVAPAPTPSVDIDTVCEGSEEFQEVGVSCTEFVLCGSNGEQIAGGVISCGPGEVFNDNTKACEDYPSPFTCSVHETNGYYADTTNCSVYHLCIGGQQFGADNICGEGRFFDQESQSCYASGPESGVNCAAEVTDICQNELGITGTCTVKEATCTSQTSMTCTVNIESTDCESPDDPNDCVFDEAACVSSGNNEICAFKEVCAASDPTAGVTCPETPTNGECEAEYPECSLTSLSDCEICPDEITRFGIDCNSYYQCTKNEDGDLVPVVRTCPEGFYYDDEGNYCDLEENVEGCPA